MTRPPRGLPCHSSLESAWWLCVGSNAARKHATAIGEFRVDITGERWAKAAYSGLIPAATITERHFSASFLINSAKLCAPDSPALA